MHGCGCPARGEAIRPVQSLHQPGKLKIMIRQYTISAPVSGKPNANHNWRNPAKESMGGTPYPSYWRKPTEEAMGTPYPSDWKPNEERLATMYSLDWREQTGESRVATTSGRSGS